MKRFLLPALSLLLVAATAARAAEQPVAHELHVQILPAEHTALITDRIVLPTAGGKGTARFRVRKEFEVLDGRGRKSVAGMKGWHELVLPVEREEGRWVARVQYRLKLDKKPHKSRAFSFVAGDSSAGYIGPEGLYLPGGSGWYPEVDGAMMRTELTVQSPAPYRVVSQGGKLGEKTVSLPGPGGKKADYIVSRWRETLPSDGLFLVGGTYAVKSITHMGVVLSTYLYPRHADMADKLLRDTAAYLEFYAELLGPYPFPKFDIVENFFTSGYGMPSYTLLGSRVFDVIRMIGLRPGFIDHELVHNWWGNSVYVDYEKGNWCEGVTTYCANYFGGREAKSGREAARYRKLACRKYSVNLSPDREYPLRAFRTKEEDFENDIGYGKGSMLFHLVRRTIGDDAFWEALQAVARDFKGRKALWEDFRAAFEKAGKKDLSRLFSQWLDWKGVPVIAFSGRIADKGWLVRGSLTARNDLDPARGYDLTVPLRVTFQDGSHRDYPVPVTGGAKDVTLMMREKKAASVALDPDFHVFRRIPRPEITPSLNAVLRSGRAVVALGGDAEQAGALAWARDRIVKHRKAVAAAEEDIARGRGQKDGFVLLGRSDFCDDLILLAEAGQGLPRGSLFVEQAEGAPHFRVNGQSYSAPDCAVLASFRLPSGAWATIFFGNSADAVKPLRNLFHYGWDQFVVFKKGRPVARGELSAAVKQAAVDSGPGLVLEKLATGFDGRRCDLGETSATREKLVDYLAGTLTEATGGEAAVEPVSFSVPRAGQTGVVRLGGSFAGMELAVPAFFPVPPRVDLGDGRKVAAAGAAFEHVVHAAAIPASLPGPTLLILDTTGKYHALEALVADLEKAPEAVKAVVLYERETSLEGKRSFTLAALRETGRGDAQMRIAGILSRLKRPYAGPIVLVAPTLQGRFELSGRVTGQVFLRREAVSVRGFNLSALIEGTGADGGKEVLLTAHFDGLGPGHQGADDNASGVACVLRAASLLKGSKLARPVRVVLFDAEEWGLYGSRAYVKAHGGRTGWVLNVDGVGSRTQEKVYVIGRTRFPALLRVLEGPLKAEGFALGADIDRFAFEHGSDHYPFAARGIPAVDLYSSQRGIMNTRDDTIDKVDFEKVERLARALARAAAALAGP